MPVVPAASAPAIDCRATAAGLALALALLTGGCDGTQSALDPKGPAAAAIAHAAWLMFWSGAAIFAVVIMLALYAVYRDPDKRAQRSSTAMIVVGGVAFPVVALSALLVYDVFLTREQRAWRPDALEVRVISRQWQWEVRYPGAEKLPLFNELRLPAGRPVRVLLSSEDVIHSFWVPNLAGKIDAIPGRVTRLDLQADRPGVFRGQCAEFCGALHAHMVLRVVAEPPEEFDRWLERLRQ